MFVKKLELEGSNLAKYKHAAKKRRLIKAGVENKPVPSWVMVKTRGKVRVNPKKRHWRHTKLKP